MKLGSAFFGQWIDGIYSVVNDYGIAIILIMSLIMNGMFIFVIPSGIGLYHFVSGLFQAIEQFAYYKVCVHRKNV